MAVVSALRCNSTGNFTRNFSSCAEPTFQSSPYEEFFKFAFGSAIFMIIVSLVSIVANSLLLLVFFFDPFKIFRNTATCFLVGLALLDLTIAVQEPMYGTCFIMMYTRYHGTLALCTTLLTVGQTMTVAAMIASLLLVLAFTITQYIVVISPLNYARKVTKTRVIICVFAIYVYAILFSLLPEMGVRRGKIIVIEIAFHDMFIAYLTIIFYILLYRAFKKKMTTSKSLQEGTYGEGKVNREQNIQRRFIIVNFLLMSILIFCFQPAVMLWIVRLYSKEDHNTPKVLIVNLMMDNLLYLKFLLDPFVYAWRIPKYRQALKIVLRCGRDKPDNRLRDRDVAKMTSHDTVITLDLKNIP